MQTNNTNYGKKDANKNFNNQKNNDNPMQQI